MASIAGELEDEEDDIDDEGQQYMEKLEKSVSRQGAERLYESFAVSLPHCSLT